MGTGALIASHVLLLYAFLAPLALFGIFVLFDALIGFSSKKLMDKAQQDKDPAVWTAQEIAAFQDQD